jgi:hypothetical protein
MESNAVRKEEVEMTRSLHSRNRKDDKSGQNATPLMNGKAVHAFPKRIEPLGSAEPTAKLDELYYKRPVRQHVKEFGAIFGVIFLAIGSWYLWRRGEFYSTPNILITLGFAFPLLAYFATPVMLPLWKGWMAFATGLGVVMTGLILSIMWTLVLIPIAFLLRIIGKRVMDTTFDRAVPTYWESREERVHDFKLLERQF